MIVSNPVSPEQRKSNMQHPVVSRAAIRAAALLCVILFTSCATPYGQEGLLGGFSDYLIAPDEATIVFHGNGYTSALRLGSWPRDLRVRYPPFRLPRSLWGLPKPSWYGYAQRPVACQRLYLSKR